MISKIQPVNFTSRIHMDRETAKHLSLSKAHGEKSYKEQLNEIKDNNNNDVVILKRSAGAQYDYLDLQVLTKDGKVANSKKDFWFISHNPGVDLVHMYNRACEKLNKSASDDSVKKAFEFFNI